MVLRRCVPLPCLLVSGCYRAHRVDRATHGSFTVMGRVWAKGGWLAQLGYVDVCGGSVVHMAGGGAALVASYMVGPRIGRYDAQANPVRMPGHSIPFAVLGILLLWYGTHQKVLQPLVVG